MFLNYKKIVPILLIILLSMLPKPAQAQWPPFNFELDSVFGDGRITYTVRLSPQVDWPLTDVVIKIPLPEGTRFVQASAPETTSHNFDGAEITFFTPTLHSSLQDVQFVVEMTDPAKTEFAAHAWLAWKGNVPGDFLTGDFTIDTTRLPLIWQRPASRLRLEASAVVVGNDITYNLYPVNVGGRRMWDVQIFMDLPPGTTFVSVEAPPPFEAGFNGQQVVFSVLELERRQRVAPLQAKVTTTGAARSLITASAWAVWNNVGRNVAQTEQTETGQIMVISGQNQMVVADSAGDAPFENYDVTSIMMQQDGEALKISLFTTGAMGQLGQPLEHYLYLDTDCNADTGKARGNRGAEYWVRYRHQNGRGYLYTWDPTLNDWADRQTLPANFSGGQVASVWLPAALLANSSEVCWIAVARNRTEAYHPAPPLDWVGTDPRLTRFVLNPAS